MERSPTFTQAELAEGTNPVSTPDLPAPATASNTPPPSLRPRKRKLTLTTSEEVIPSPKKSDRGRSSSLSNLSRSSSSPIDESLEPGPPAKSLAEIREAHEKAGLEYPPPEYNLEGRWNTDELTGVLFHPRNLKKRLGVANHFLVDQRRHYSVKARKILPFHHDPVMHGDRKTYSASVRQVVDYIDEKSRAIIKRDSSAEADEFYRLQQVRRFVEESSRLDEYDPSGRNRSIENRMEDLMMKYDETMKKKETLGSKGKAKEKEQAETSGSEGKGMEKEPGLP
ncbi:MAG: hypothetical protein LQ344_003673 [Seirophora lacunosa]|nr:MAG: hypothetical protein LQ344_003673 [Seirophora lacunosa]